MDHIGYHHTLLSRLMIAFGQTLEHAKRLDYIEKPLEQTFFRFNDACQHYTGMKSEVLGMSSDLYADMEYIDLVFEGIPGMIGPDEPNHVAITAPIRESIKEAILQLEKIYHATQISL